MNTKIVQKAFIFFSLTFNILASTISLDGSVYQIRPLDPSQIEEGEEYQYSEVKSDVVVTKKDLEEIGKSGNISIEECQLEDLSLKSFQTEDGQTFHAIYSSEDRCDGGNSMGIVYNEDKSKVVATIFDGDISSL